MHVAIIIDDERLENEQAMLNRLCVGLIDEGARVTRIVPEGSDSQSEGERAVALAARIEYPINVVPWLRSQRRRRIVEKFERSLPDVLYASGRETWALAIELAAEMDRPLAFDVWGMSLAARVPRLRGRSLHACYVAATEAAAKALRQRVSSDLVATIPIGVSVPPEPFEILDQADRASGIAVLGRCRNPAGYRVVAKALEGVVQRRPQVHIVLELDGPREHEIWRLFRAAGLMSRTSAILRAQVHRQLLTRCDIAILPETDGEIRTVVLELMAAGVPIITRADPAIGLLVPDRTAAVVRDLKPEPWAAAIRRIIAEPQYAADLARNARAWIDQKHRSSRQAHDLFQVLQKVVTGGTYKFTSAVAAKASG